MESGSSFETPTFATPNEEIAYLREQVRMKEAALVERGADFNREHVVRDTLKEYVKPQGVERGGGSKPAEAVERKMTLDIDPEAHDQVMGALLGVIHEKGILAAMREAMAMRSPHIEDDFHRFLVAYVAAGMPARDLEREPQAWRSARYVLYEVSVPEPKTEESQRDAKRPLKELLAPMEQFFAGLMSVALDPRGSNGFTLELANPQGTTQFVFYVAIPSERADLFEKHTLSVFPDANVRIEKNDYNIFIERGSTVASEAKLTAKPALPLKTYESFERDPMNVMLGALGKLKDIGEGAAVQLIVVPDGAGKYVKGFKNALEAIQKGESKSKSLDVQFSLWGQFKKDLKETVVDLAKDSLVPKGAKSEEEKDKPKPVDDIIVEHIKRKISTSIHEATLRVVVSAETSERAETIAVEIESAFNQFAESTANSLKFSRAKGKELDALVHDFTYRIPSSNPLPLNLAELASVMHFPVDAGEVAPSLKTSKAAVFPVPIDMPTEGILLGTNEYRGLHTKVFMTPEDRLRHFYVIGQTGTGKTSLLKNMIVQDIKNGDGCCFIDPHGSDIDDIIAQIPKERYEDVIYFDPGNADRPMGLNMLEYDVSKPEQKIFVVNELFGIFQKLYSANPEAMGPMFEQYFRNATMLTIEDPSTGTTLLEVSRVLASAEFRAQKLAACKNPVVTQFWREIAEKAGGEASLGNIVPYITSKFDVFMANDIMRPIIAQEKSAFDFRSIMDDKKILLVNLSKGKLGEINSSLIGLILVGKILMAALSRVDVLGKKELAPFYLYVDEFQNVTTPSISTILSEARKYKLSLNMAHQFVAQLDDGIRDSVFGNVGSMAVFRVGNEDAEVFEKQLAPTVNARDIRDIENHNAYVRMLSKGAPIKPFSLRTVAPEKGDRKKGDLLKELSYLKYGRPREEVEREIMERF
jgi:hypothetical protein